jgi:hypothetical protein
MLPPIQRKRRTSKKNGKISQAIILESHAIAKTKTKGIWV